MSKRTFFLCFGMLTLTLIATVTAQGQQVNKALDLFLKNDVSGAEAALQKIWKESSGDEKGKAAISLALINKLNENTEEKVKYYVNGICNLTEPDAYAYTLWGDCSFFNYPEWSTQIRTYFAKRSVIHPDLNYCLDHLSRRLFIRNDQLDSVMLHNKLNGVIDQWEFLGPFDYNDGYGYMKDEQTVAHPEKNYEFHGRYNAPLKWFSMMEGADPSDIYLNEFIDQSNSSSSKMYAQTFLQSDVDQTITLNIICGFDIRCWVNDEVVYENRKNIENITSLPFHLTVALKKGVNRLLFQLGKKSEYGNNFEVYVRDQQDRRLSSLVSQTKNRSYTPGHTGVKPLQDPDIVSFNVNVFTEYLKQHPDDILEQLLRIEELNSNGDKIKTLKALTSIYQKYPNSYYLSNMYYNNKPNINYSTKDEYLNQKCENCFSSLNKKFEDAIEEKDKTKIKETLEALEKNYPGNLSVYLRRIDYFMDEDEYAEAAKLIDAGLSKYKNNLVFCSYKSSLLKAQAKKDEHLAYLKSILPTRYNTFVSDRMKEAYLDNNDTINWIELQKQDIRYDKADDNYYTLLNIYNKGKKYELSEQLIKAFLIKKPYSARGWEEYGDLMAEKSDKKKAVEYYQKSLLFNPLNYDLVKKLNTNLNQKTELERYLPATLKEVYQSASVASQVIPANLKNKNWVILLRKSASVIYDGGLTATKTFVFYKILNEAGITEFKEFNGGGGSDVMIFKEDGSVVLPESGFSSVVLTDLKVGDIIGVKYDNESSAATGYVTTKYHTFLTSLENDPMLLMEDDNLVSKSMDSKPFIYDEHKVLTMEKKDWNAQFVLYSIKSKNPLYIEPEMYPKDLLFNHAFIALHNYQTWKEVADWYWDIASPTLIADDSVKYIVKQVLKGKEKSSQFEKARLCYQWIEKNINYSSQAFRQDNYVPQLPSKVVQDKLGDCKDLSALFIVMCREAGIAGNFCLVNMENRAGLFHHFPNINFNHCIARIYPDGKPYYVELTSKNLPFAQNVHYASYAFGLEIQPDKNSTITDLWNEGANDYLMINADVTNKDSKVAMTGDIRISGVTGAVLKDAFEKIDSSQIQTALQKLVAEIIPNTAVESCSYNSKDKWNDTVIISYQAACPEIFTDVAELYVYKLPVFLKKILEESTFANVDRKTDMSLLQAAGMMGEASSDLTISIPPSKKLFKKPDNSSIDNRFFSYTVSLSENKGSVTIHRTFKPKTKAIAVADFAAFKAEMDKAYKNDVTTLVLQ